MSEQELDFEARFSELLDPFKEMLRLVRKRKEKISTELERIRSEERQLVRALKAIDPSFEQKTTKATTKGYHVAEERLVYLTKWLDEHRSEIAEKFPDGWTGTTLFRDFYAANGNGEVGLSSFQAAIAKLHDRGVVRLDRRGQGGSKIYKAIG